MTNATFHLPNFNKKDKGVQFEEEILYTVNTYNQGKEFLACYLERSEIPRINIRGRTVYTEKKGFDLIGGVNLNNIIIRNEKLIKLKESREIGYMRTLCIEAKCIDDCLPIHDNTVSFNEKGKKKNKGHGVKYHQLKALCELQKSGAICMILWKTKTEKDKTLRVYKIDPLQMSREVKLGTSISPEKHKHLLTEVPQVGLAWDFLNLLKRR